MNRRLEVSPGDVYGRLRVLREVEPKLSGGQRQRCVECECECGEVGEYRLYSLRNGNTRSCGCLSREMAVERGHRIGGGKVIHGGTGTAEYRTWSSMKSRCTNANNPGWDNYGGRGITVCERWLESFPAFLEDMGRRPSERHSIHRVDNDGNYEPGNCVWATAEEQARNKRNSVYIEHNGERILLVEMVETLKESLDGAIPIETVEHRLRCGKSVRESTRPVRGTFVEFEGKTVSLSDLCLRFGQPLASVKRRLKRGMSLQEALTFSDNRSDSFFRIAVADRDKRWYAEYERRIQEKRRRFAEWLASVCGDSWQ